MAGTHAVQLTIEAAGIASGFTPRFDSFRGTAFLRKLLEDAGLTGAFTYHLKEWFKSSGFTKPVQPRRFDNTGVHLWLKPGGNGSAIKGVLVPDKGRYTAEEVFTKLRQYVAAQEKKAPDADEAPATLDDAATELLLLAVNEANGTYHKSQDEFDAAVLTSLRGCSFEADADALDRMMEATKRRGFVSYTNTGAIITLEGQEWLNGRGEAAAAASTQASAPAAPVSALDLLTAKRAKLERLMSLPELVRQSRDKQASLAAQIEALMGQLDAEKGVELELMAEVNEDAVRRLLGD